MSKHSLPLLALAALTFTACSAAPVVVRLNPFSVDFAAVSDTNGRVVYPAAPAAFERPILNVKDLRIDGDLTASNIFTEMTFTFYGRTADPATDPSCTRVATYYLCDAQSEVPVSSSITFTPSKPQQPVVFGGQVLVNGVNRGSIWLGARVDGAASVMTKLDFKNLRASITLF